MLIKVCGIADAENARQVASLSPDLMGFIFYGPSPRNALSLPPEAVRDLPAIVKRAGVFVDETEEFILAKVNEYGLEYVQLHGDESPEFCRNLKGKVPGIIKAFGISGPEDFNRVVEYENLCDMYIFDTKTPSKGGSGLKFDHGALECYRGVTPFLLSGGIGPEDTWVVENLHLRCTGVDLNSRFETSPGIKDIVVLGKYIDEIKNKQI